jgi:hypothetical protein
MSDEKKPRRKFNDTGFGKFLKDKVKPLLGDGFELAADLTGIQLLNAVGNKLNEKRDEDAQIAALASEFEMKKLEWEMELGRMEHDFRLAELTASVDSFKLEIEDLNSARNREIEFMKSSGGKRDWLMSAVVIIGLAAMMFVIGSLIFVHIPDANKELAYMSFGAVMTIGTQIFAYYVGSSRGSKMKDDTIRKMK